jgi:hypothetical protein
MSPGCQSKMRANGSLSGEAQRIPQKRPTCLSFWLAPGASLATVAQYVSMAGSVGARDLSNSNALRGKGSFTIPSQAWLAEVVKATVGNNIPRGRPRAGSSPAARTKTEDRVRQHFDPGRFCRSTVRQANKADSEG